MLRIFSLAMEVKNFELFYADFSVQFQKWQNLLKTVIYLFWYQTRDDDVLRPRVSVLKHGPLLLFRCQHGLRGLIVDGVTEMFMSCYPIPLMTARNCVISENITRSVTGWTEPWMLVNRSSQTVSGDYDEFLRTHDHSYCCCVAVPSTVCTAATETHQSSLLSWTILKWLLKKNLKRGDFLE